MRDDRSRLPGFCLWPDRYQDILWVGTDGYGAFMYCDKQASFTTLLMSDLPEKVFNPYGLSIRTTKARSGLGRRAAA